MTRVEISLIKSHCVCCLLSLRTVAAALLLLPQCYQSGAWSVNIKQSFLYTAMFAPTIAWDTQVLMLGGHVFPSQSVIVTTTMILTHTL